jgi:hypothetical protein
MHICQAREASKNLKPVFNVLKELVVEANLHFTRDGLILTSVDVEKTTVVELSLLNMMGYDWKEDVTIGILPIQINKIIRSTLPNDIIMFSILEGDMHTLRIDIEGEQTSITSYLPHIDIVADRVGFPTFEPDCVVDIQSKVLHKVLKDLSAVSKKFSILTIADTDEIIFRSENDLTTIQQAIKHPEWITRNNQESNKSTYQLKNLERFCKSDINKMTSLEYHKEKPLVLKKSIPLIGQIKIAVAQLK